MFYSLARTFSFRSAITRAATRVYSQSVSSTKEKPWDEQIDYIKLIARKNTQDWGSVKNDILSKQGNINHKNIDAIMLKSMVSSKNYDNALSFAQYLKSTSAELSLGIINGILSLYYEMGKLGKLSNEQKQFILDTYTSLHKKYEVLDSTTGDRVLHALCIISEWEKALSVLSDIHISNVPTHSAYSTAIATLFKLNKKKKALELIDESLKHKRPLLESAYEEWINYIVRKYKNKEMIAKHLDEIFSYVAKNCALIPMHTANKLKELYSSMDWNAQFSRIRKANGQCSCCKDTLNCLSLTNEEFNLLQQNVKEKLIVGSDLFLKTSPDELKRFLKFVERTGPYDIVLDGLNIAYAVGMAPRNVKLEMLSHVVDNFVSQKKKILLLGRKHMLGWNKIVLQQITRKTNAFFTENISQDDPYFITAAILSGPQTDIVSKDLLRGHQFLLKDVNLRLLFKRWQWQHQWMVFQTNQSKPNIQPPLTFTPCAQKKGSSWHLPFERETLPVSSQFSNGTPDLYSWICLRQTK